MKLKRNSRIVRWAYFCSGEAPPFRTSLCAIFWRSVLVTPLMCLMFFVAFPIIALAGLYVLGVLAWQHRVGVGEAALVAVGMLGLGWLAAVLSRREYRVRAVLDESVLWQGAKAVKGKFCPLVEIE